MILNAAVLLLAGVLFLTEQASGDRNNSIFDDRHAITAAEWPLGDLQKNCTCKADFVSVLGNLDYPGRQLLRLQYELEEDYHVKRQQCATSYQNQSRKHAHSNLVPKAPVSNQDEGEYPEEEGATTTQNKRSSKVGSPCNENDGHCGIEHTSCVGPTGARTCSCDALTHVPSKDRSRCLAKVELGGDCAESSQCFATVANSKCSSSAKCQCSADFIAPPLARTRCNRRAAHVGDSCSEHDNQCVLGGTKCRRGETAKDGRRPTCECLPGYKEGPGGIFCIKKTTHKNGSTEEIPVSTLVLAALGTLVLTVVITLIIIKILSYTNQNTPVEQVLQIVRYCNARMFIKGKRLGYGKVCYGE